MTKGLALAPEFGEIIYLEWFGADLQTAFKANKKRRAHT